MEGGEVAQAAEGIGAIWPIVVTAVLSVIATLGTTWFGHWLGLSKDRELRDEEIKRHARYLAIRVICVLDPFIGQCVEVTYDGGERDQDGEMRPRLHAPSISFPNDVDWKSIDPDLMYAILGFPNEIADAERALDMITENVSGPPDYEWFFWGRTEHYGRLGLMALEIADALRKTYQIPKRDYSAWHPRRLLNEQIEKSKKAREVFEKRQADLTRKMSEDYEANKAADAAAASPKDAS